MPTTDGRPNPDYTFTIPRCPLCGAEAIAIKEVVPVFARLIPEGDGYSYCGDSECVWDAQGPELHWTEYGDDWHGPREAQPSVTLQCANGDTWETGLRCASPCTAGLMPGESCDHCGAVCPDDEDCPRCGRTGEEPGVPFDDRDGVAICSLCHGHGTLSFAEAKAYHDDN